MPGSHLARRLAIPIALLVAPAGCGRRAPPARTDDRKSSLQAEREERRRLTAAHRRAAARRRARPRPRPAPTSLELATVRITGARHYRSHAHGGKAAAIRDARFRLQARGTLPAQVRVEALELLHAHCGSTGWGRATPLSIRRVELDDEPVKGPPHVVRLTTPGERTVRVVFAPSAVYQACDRFGYRARFTVGGASGWVEAPLQVVRRQPARRDHRGPPTR